MALWAKRQRCRHMIEHMLDSVIARGDLAHLAHLMWAAGASLASAKLLKELGAANRRFDAFVRELHHFNARLSDGN